MKVAQFIELLKNPNDLNESHIPDLEKIVGDYPFFQSAHLLYAKALQNSKHINYYNALKRTSVIAGNRAVLYRLIYQQPKKENPTQESIAKEEIIVRIPSITQQEEIMVPVSEEKVIEPITEKLETIPPTTFFIPTNVVYNVVENQETKTKSQEADIEPKKKIKQEASNKGVLEQEIARRETLDEIALKPIIEAYVETEILKLTEKEPDIKVDEPRSFTEWLKKISDNEYHASNNKYQVANSQSQELKIKKKEQELKPEAKTSKVNILDKLLAEDLRISKPQADKNFFAASQKTRSSVLEDENLVTETLAKIYVLQGNQQKAVRAYEILSLKFPEKSAYFATLINELKNNLK